MGNRKMVFKVIFILFLSFMACYMADAQSTIDLPKTGQTRCYDGKGKEIPCPGTSQDGEFQIGVDWPNPRFKLIYCHANGPCPDTHLDCDGNASNDVVLDHLTGLMWARDGNLFGSYNPWDQTLEKVASYNQSHNLCGFDDWRLPNVNEIETLVNASEPNTSVWLNSKGFLNIQPYHYWSSSIVASVQCPAWVVDMKYGHIMNGSNTNYRFVLPVRLGKRMESDPRYQANLWKTGQKKTFGSGDDGELQMGITWPSPRFHENHDQTVTDSLTGLIWAKEANAPGPKGCNPGKSKTWEGALNHVACLNVNKYLGFSDWRLPNRKELLSLMDRSKSNPALLEGHPFLSLQSKGDYWSSTTFAGIPDSAWTLDLFLGSMNHGHKRYPNFVWPLRGGVRSGSRGIWKSLNQTCQLKKIFPICKIKGSLEISNLGNSETSLSVEFFLSDDKNLSEGDTFLKEEEIRKIKVGESLIKNFKYRVPWGKSASGKYLIAVIKGDPKTKKPEQREIQIISEPIP